MKQMDKSFDRSAAGWDADAGRVDTARKVAQAIRKRVKLKRTMNILDFGCGTGLVSMELIPLVGSFTGVDISKKMLNIFQEKVNNRKIKNVQLLNRDWQSPDFGQDSYDLIYSSMSLHHIAEHLLLLKKFYALLNAGGSLCLADLYPESGDFHSDPKIAAHFGFDPEILANQLIEIGFKAATYEKITTIHKPVASGEMKTFPVFLLTAEKDPKK